MFSRLQFAFLIVTLFLSILPAQGQQIIENLSEEAQISLLTIKPGDEVYSLFGHSALRVYDPVLGIDVTYNYGTFDFGDPLIFVFRFAYGKLDYMLSASSYSDLEYSYRMEGRPIIEQVLNLSPAQREEVFRFLQINALPQNRSYRYDFLFDNCSTRPRDVLETVLSENVTSGNDAGSGKSFRQLLDLYLRERPELDLGIDLLLGMPVDRIATAREASFLPDFLMESFAHASVEIDGSVQPLVARTDTVFWVEGYDAVDSALPWPSILLTLFLLLGIALTVQEYRGKHSGHRWLDILLFLVAGVAGLLIVFLWFISEHTVTDYNWNLLWAWPTHFIVAIMMTRRTWARTSWLRYYFAGSVVITALFMLGWPFWPQNLNESVLPLVLLLALRSAWQALKRNRLTGKYVPEPVAR